VRTCDRDDEDGLTLVEMLVALFVVALVLMAMASTSIASLSSISQSERVVRSTHLGSEVLEELVATPFEYLGLYQDEATAEFGPTGRFEGDDLVVFPNPTERDDRVPLPREDVTRDGIPYEVSTAIVWDDRGGASDSYKRLIVDLTWTVRGDTRTSRVESVVAATPEDQPLNVTVAPEVIALDDDGRNVDAFELEAVAIEPQSAVKVEWIARDGARPEASMTTDDGGTTWRLPFNALTRRFANGGTLFEVIATSSDGTRETTTIGRATFLQALDIDADSLDVEPSPLLHHPVDGLCSGFTMTVDVEGALLSDPLTSDLFGLDADEQPLEALEPLGTLVDGTRYGATYDADELEVAPSDENITFELRIERAADLVDDRLQVVIPIDQLDSDGSEEVASCPAS
jgi:prepilin-type N-terminal cleavage/methylation domain-containing protein